MEFPGYLKSALKSTLEKISGIEDLEQTVFIQALHVLDRVNHQAAAELAMRRFAKPRRLPEPDAESKLAREGTQIEFRCGLVGYKFGSGKIILLVHGWGGRGLQLGALIEPLVNSGYSVVSLDGPAHGKSPGDWTSPTHFATFMRTVGLELGPLHAVVAHSFGAGCTVLALENGLQCEKAVLVSAPNRYAQVVERFCSNVALSPEAKHLFYNLVTYKVGISSRDFLLANYFSRVKQPTLLIHDKNDKELEFSESEALALANSNAKIVITEGLGHRRILKSDIFVQECMEFLI